VSLLPTECICVFRKVELDWKEGNIVSELRVGPFFAMTREETLLTYSYYSGAARSILLATGIQI
jgi:hypothetical protein